MNLPTLTDRLRRPQATDIVQLDMVGAPKAVTAIARALASIAVVTSMQHTASTSEQIRLQVTCHPSRGRRG